MITQPYPNFIRPDAGGNVKPISNGLIYIGKEGLDPVSNPIDVFYIDNAGTEQKIDQPIRLNATGIPVAGENDGTIILPYTKASVYSILIADKIGDPKYTDLSSTGLVSGSELSKSILQAQNEVVSGNIFKGKGGDSVANGDEVPAGTTHLIIKSSSGLKVVLMSPQASGVISNLTENSASIGGVDVKFLPVYQYLLEVKISELIGLSNGTDDTEKVQEVMILASVMNFILVIDSSYVINPLRTTKDESGATVHVHGLLTRPYLRMKWIPGKGVFTCVPNDQDRYCMLLVNHEGVELEYPKVIGDRDNHITTADPGNHDGFAGEWGYGIRFDSGSRKIKVTNPDVTKCWGDSLIIVTDQDDFGELVNTYAADSRRQGLSVIRGRGIKLSGVTHFERINGTFPMAGMDIEPDLATEVIDIEITGVIKVNDCVGYALEHYFLKQNSSSKPHNVRYNCIVMLDNWMRILSPKGTGVKNSIHFDEAHCRLMMFDTMNSQDLITVDRLYCDEPANFRLTTDNEATKGFARIRIGKIIPSFTSGNAWTIGNSSQLSYMSFDEIPVKIGEFLFEEGVDIGAPTPANRHSFPIEIGSIKSSETVAGTSSNLQLFNFRALDVFLDRTVTTSMTVDKDSIQLGTTKTIRSEKSLTGFICGTGVSINGGTDTLRLTPPYKVELYTDDGVNFNIKSIYDRGSEYVTP